jgi:predicted GIY-YIG superfamily endonuclease
MVTVYRLYSATDDLLYVGITNSIIHRFGQHLATKPWFPEVSRATFQHFASRVEAHEAERRAVRTERPRHNIHRFAGTRKPGQYKNRRTLIIIPGDLRAQLDTYVTRANALFYPMKLTMTDVMLAALGEYLDRHEPDVSAG